MATLRVVIKGELGQISARSLASVLQHSLYVLRSLDHRISERPKGTLHWVVENIGHGSSIDVLLGTRVVHGDRDFSSDVHGRFAGGIQIIRREEGTPPYFSTDDVIAVREIVRGFGQDGVTGVAYEPEAAKEPAELTHEIEPELIRLTGVAYHALGAIEGRVEVVSVRRKWRHFTITDERTRRAIKCNLPYALEDAVFEAIKERRRVVARGLIAYNLRNEPMRLEVRGSLRFLGKPEELPTIAELAGSDPNLTGDMDTEDFIRSLRDG